MMQLLLKMLSYIVFPPKVLPRHNLNTIKSFYDKSLEYVVRSVRELLTLLEEFSYDSVFIITSDHGEEFMEHGALGHLGIRYGAVTYPHLHEENINVPLIIASPNIDSDICVESLTSHIDIALTILGINVSDNDRTHTSSNSLHHLYNKFFLGNNLFKFIGNDKGVINNFIIAEADAMIIHGADSIGESYALIKYFNKYNYFKYIWHPILGEALYDLERDPHEKLNLFDSLPEIARKLREELLRYLKFKNCI